MTAWNTFRRNVLAISSTYPPPPPRPVTVAPQQLSAHMIILTGGIVGIVCSGGVGIILQELVPGPPLTRALTFDLILTCRKSILASLLVSERHFNSKFD